MKGAFITFEGIEGCGKTTQARLAGEYLAGRAVSFVATEEPGGTPFGRALREILLNPGPYPLCGEAELFLFSAARVQHVRQVIQPALAEGKMVLCDRFTDATLAYQGYGRGLDKAVIGTLGSLATSGLTPDMTLLFDLPVEAGLARAFARIAARNPSLAAEDRFEREARSFHERVRQGYLSLAHQAPKRFRMIDADRDVEAIAADVCRHLDDVLAKA